MTDYAPIRTLPTRDETSAGPGTHAAICEDPEPRRGHD